MNTFYFQFILQKSNLNFSILKWTNLKWTNKKERRKYQNQQHRISCSQKAIMPMKIHISTKQTVVQSSQRSQKKTNGKLYNSEGNPSRSISQIDNLTPNLESTQNTSTQQAFFRLFPSDYNQSRKQQWWRLRSIGDLFKVYPHRERD